MTDLPPNKAPTIRVTAMPADANPYGDIFGGWLMGQMDLAAGSVASRRSGPTPISMVAAIAAAPHDQITSCPSG